MSEAEFTTTQLSQDERLLIERLQAGDAAAIAALERRFGPELRLFCRRMLSNVATAEDVVQDVFATCCRVDPELFPTHSVRGWLYKIARRRCIDTGRRRRDAAPGAEAVRRVQPGFDNAIDPLTTPAGKALKRDRAARILTLLDDLDDDLRSVVVMRYFQDLSRKEIAEAIGLSLAGTKARLARAMDELRKLLGAEDSRAQ